jgi:hypothetical protein
VIIKKDNLNEDKSLTDESQEQNLNGDEYQDGENAYQNGENAYQDSENAYQDSENEYQDSDIAAEQSKHMTEEQLIQQEMHNIQKQLDEENKQFVLSQISESSLEDERLTVTQKEISPVVNRIQDQKKDTPHASIKNFIAKKREREENSRGENSPKKSLQSSLKWNKDSNNQGDIGGYSKDDLENLFNEDVMDFHYQVTK